MRTLSKLWTAAVATCLATLVLAALILPQSFRLTALSDVVQCLLLFSGALSLILHVVRSRGRLRLFFGQASGLGLVVPVFDDAAGDLDHVLGLLLAVGHHFVMEKVRAERDGREQGQAR